MAGNFGNGWCGNHVGQLLITLAMFGTIPHAFTRTSTSVGRGVGTSIVSTDIGSPSACSRAASIFAIDILLGTAPSRAAGGGDIKNSLRTQELGKGFG